MATLWHTCHRSHAEPSLQAYKLSPQLSFAMHVCAPSTSQVVFRSLLQMRGGRGACRRCARMRGVHAHAWVHACMCGVWHMRGPCAHAWGWGAPRGHTCMHRHTWGSRTHAQGVRGVGAEKVSHHCYNLSSQVAVKTRDREIN